MTDLSVDINKVATNLVQEFSKTILSSLYEVGSKQYRKALVIFNRCYSSYINRAYKRYSSIKTLLYRDRPVLLKKHYVETRFSYDLNVIDERNLNSDLARYKHIVIEGTAGSGKSLYMRNLFLKLVENGKSTVPILVELRNIISNEENSSIIEYILKILKEQNDNFSLEQLELALKMGRIILLLDGFDEIDYTKIERYEREILSLSNKFPDTIILVSSRPDDCFESWEEFHLFKILPFSKQQAMELVDKIEYDTLVKNKFLSELDEWLYDKHRDFLSNPLLTTMMLLTYEQLAEIPQKIHIFYEQAFDTLFHKHDALKALYKRKSYTNLPIDDFKRLFSAFCIITYSDNKYEFTENEIKEYIEKARQVENIDIPTDAFLNDLLKSVCIIQRDGLSFVFTHRSFQEYFSAYFLANTRSIELAKILDELSQMPMFRGNVIPILFELNKELVEREWIIPRLEIIVSSLNGIDPDKNPIQYLSEFHNLISIDHKIHRIICRAKPSKKRNAIIGWCLRLYKKDAQQVVLKIKEEEVTHDYKVFCKNIPNLNKDKYKHRSQWIDLNNLSLIQNNWIKDTYLFKHRRSIHSFLMKLHKDITQKYESRTIRLSQFILKDN